MLKRLLPLLILVFVLSCSKDNEENTNEPENLTVTIVSIDEKTTEVEIQASATNTELYNMYIGEDETPVLSNNTGLFKYTFGYAGVYNVTIRAYGESGRYLKKNIEVALGEYTVSLEDGYHSPDSYEGYDLVWADEFNGTSVNTEDWKFETGAGGWGNNELQYYRAENAWVSEGTLTIEAREEAFSGSQYTSTRMITKGKQFFKYGRIDIRALLPEGKGLWPALWMLGENIYSVGWPACGEIDIMEMVGGNGGESTTHGTLHWDIDGHVYDGGSKTVTGETLAQKYHVFSIEWNENYIKWFLDGQQFHAMDITPDHMSEFHKEFFFILNVAVGGNWPGSPDGTTKFPQQMKVDYIRVFQSN